MATKWDDNEEIQIFREYLRIPSVQPDVDYGTDSTNWQIDINKQIFRSTILKIIFSNKESE